MLSILAAAVALQAAAATSANLVLVTNDAAIIKNFRALPANSWNIASYSKLLKQDQFEVATWNGYGIVAVDRNIPWLSELERVRALTSAVAAKMSEDGTVQIGDLPPEARSAALEIIGEHVMMGAQYPAFNANTLAVGINPIARLQFTTGDGRVVNVDIPTENKQTAAMRASLTNHPFPQPTPITPSALAADQSKRAEAASVRDSVKFVFTGPLRARAPDGIFEASNLMLKMKKEAMQRRDDAIRPLLERMKVAEAEAVATSTFSDLPQSVRDTFGQNLTYDWRPYGFASQADALAAFQNARSYNFHVELGLTYCTDAGDPTRKFSGGLGMISFGSFGH